MPCVPEPRYWLPVLAFSILSGPCLAGEFYEQDGIAIKGYDPVAYFMAHSATKGSAEYTATYKGSTFRFVDAANRDAFTSNPEKYAPQYDGYCAYGVSHGAKAKIEGEAFTIVDNKLYLNYDKTVLSTWSKDIPGNLKKADKNWPTVKSLTKVVQ